MKRGVSYVRRLIRSAGVAVFLPLIIVLFLCAIAWPQPAFAGPEAQVTNPNMVFHRLYVIGAGDDGEREEWEGDYEEVKDELEGKGKQGNNSTSNTIGLTTPATYTKFKKAIEDLKKKAKSGEEVTIFFSGHGYGGKRLGHQDNAPRSRDEPYDESFWLSDTDGDGKPGKMRDESVLDDDFAEMLKGFKANVSVTVMMDACYGGGFAGKKGPTKKGDIVQTGLVRVIGAYVLCPTDGFNVQTLSEDFAGGLSAGTPFQPADSDKDGIVTAQELTNYLNNKDWRLGEPFDNDEDIRLENAMGFFGRSKGGPVSQPGGLEDTVSRTDGIDSRSPATTCTAAGGCDFATGQGSGIPPEPVSTSGIGLSRFYFLPEVDIKFGGVITYDGYGPHYGRFQNTNMPVIEGDDDLDPTCGALDAKAPVQVGGLNLLFSGWGMLCDGSTSTSRNNFTPGANFDVDQPGFGVQAGIPGNVPYNISARSEYTSARGILGIGGILAQNSNALFIGEILFGGKVSEAENEGVFQSDAFAGGFQTTRTQKVDETSFSLGYRGGIILNPGGPGIPETGLQTISLLGLAGVDFKDVDASDRFFSRQGANVLGDVRRSMSENKTTTYYGAEASVRFGTGGGTALTFSAFLNSDDMAFVELDFDGPSEIEFNRVNYGGVMVKFTVPLGAPGTGGQ